MRFEYGRTTGYGSLSARVDAGAATATSRSRSGSTRLRPNTRYHFRAVATNAAGTTRSLDRSFVTTREPTGVTIALTPSRVDVGQQPDRHRPHRRHRRGRHRVALERQGCPFQRGFSRDRDKDREQRRLVPLQRPLALRDHALPRRDAHRERRLQRDPHGVERGEGPRARQVAGRKRARISARSGRACPNGRVPLQKRSPHGRWVVVKRSRRSRSTPTARATAST